MSNLGGSGITTRGRRGQVLAGAVIALLVMAFGGLALVSLADQSLRTVERAKRELAAQARAEAGLVAARLEIERDMLLSQGGQAYDGATGSGEVPGFADTGEARWEWEIRVVKDGAYWRTSQLVRGYGTERGRSEVMLERQLRSYSLLNYSWFSRSGSQSFGAGFQTDGAIYAGADLYFNHYQNQYFGSRTEASRQLQGRGDDVAENRTFVMPDMPKDYVPGVVLDTDVQWFQQSQATALDGGIVLPPGYDYHIDMTGVDWTQPGSFTVKRRARASWENTKNEVRDSSEGTWNDYAVTIPLDFNGVIFAGAVDDAGAVTQRSSVKLEGTCQYQGLSVVATDDAFVAGHTYGGTTNGDFVRDGRHPESDSAGTGDPVNVALVARNHVRIAHGAPRILEFEVACCAVEGSIRQEYYDSSFNDSNPQSNPVVSPYDDSGNLTGWDLDMNGVIETNNTDGWNELTLDPVHSGQNSGIGIWHLRTMGPLVGNEQPSMSPWAYYPQKYASRPHNRLYGYDADILRHEPPVFPAALNLNTPSAWTQRQVALGQIAGLEFLAPPGP